ncbi:Ig-like domain repeat protein [Methanosphaera sp. BMS]|uniref:Ig-like domain repeat protein n=1 Tax=Methanosphaera sp. BMS TaxID=1789762 RepID=UPI000DC1DC7A|nr:Ig-like domain repeat protein [Methanosphaera sp. BMS]AWX32480.1 hypothetical protein AW729_04900 [Methanosphaera sp. BMS]
MSNKKAFLFVMAIIFLIIGVSAVSAAGASVDDVTSSSDISQNAGGDSVNIQTIVKEESNLKTASVSDNFENDVNANDKIVKDGQNIKTAPKTIVITNSTIDSYFDYSEDSLGLKSSVSAGDTLDFQGNIDRPGKTLVIDKPVNITASKANSRIYLNTTAQSMFGDDEIPCFMVTKGGSYSNISGIFLYNTQLYVKNANHVTINNISTQVQNQRVGSGVGQTSIRDNSSYIIIENSTFTTENNGGSSTFVLAWASHCTIRNNIVRGIGEVGNLIYLTTYNVEGVNENITSSNTLNSHNLIDNNTIYGPANPSSIRWGIVICGKENIVSNNKIYYNGTGITQQYMADGRPQSIDTTIINNELYGCKLYCPEGGIVVNNTVQGELVPAANAQIYNNTANSLTLSSNMIFANNTINGNVTIPSNTKNITLENCTINGNVSVKTGDSSSSIPANITLENLQINGAITLTSRDGAVDTFTVKNNNITDGIYLSSKRSNQIKNVLIENNIINSDDEYAVYVNKTVTNVTIKNNRINSTSLVGDAAVYVNSADNDVTIKDNKEPQKATQITLNNVASTIVVNEKLNITGTFKVEGKGAKTTNITVYDNNNKLATISSNENGVFSYTFNTTKTGQYNISFKFAANDTLFASNASKTITVNKAPTTITVVASPSSVYVTQKVAFNATFKANNAAANVTSLDVYDNGVKVTSVGPSGNNGVVSYTYTAATAGSHNITFKFAGNASYLASESGKVITVNNPVATSITLAGNSSVYYNESLVITGTFKANNAAAKVNSVDVYNGTKKLATVSSDDTGKFTYTFKSTVVGNHNLSFRFAGNVSHQASQANKTVTVNKIPTAIVVVASPSSVYVTQKVSFNATFKAKNAAAKVNSVDVYDNNAKITSVGPSGSNGVVSYTYTAGTNGSHNITFKFAGNASHLASESGKVITVNNPVATSITLAGNSSVYYNESLVITGTFKANNAAAKVNSVDVYNGTKKLATVSSDDTGKFTYTFKSTVVGNHNLSFRFAGNVSHQASQANKTVTVNKISTAIVVVASPSSVYVTEKVSFNATFKAKNAAAKVNSVDVYDNNAKITSVGPSGSNGVVSYTYTAGTAGSHNITFKFAGNASHLASEATQTITVKNPATTSITLTSNATSIYLTEKANITGTFKEANKAIKANTITVTDNGKQVATVGPTGTDGVFNYIFDGTTPGNHNLTFKFAGNVSHTESQSSIIITVDAPNATAIQLTTNATELFVDESAKIDALFTLVDQTTGTYVEQLTITDNDEQIATVGPADDGKLTYTYQAKEVGSHDITFKFAGNVSHIASEYTITIVVKEPDATEITLTSDAESLYVDETAKVDVLFAYAGENEGTYVGSIMVSDNDEFVTLLGPSQDGVLSYEYVATEIGSHELSFMFIGNNTHAHSESIITIIVKEPDATEIQLTVDGETAFNQSESSVINGVFKFADENEGTYVDLITIYEDDVEIATAGPSDDGTFTYTYTPQKPGDHVLTFKYAGNNTHAAAESSINYYIRGYVLKVDTTDFIKGQTATIQASIYFENEVSQDINKGKVTFKVNGKTLKDENGKIIYAKIVNGTAKIENYLIPESWADKNFTIQAQSTASSQVHMLKSELETLNVHEEEGPSIEEPQLTTEDVTAKVGSPITLKATLTDNDKVVNEGKVVFKVNGKSLKDENGKVVYAKIVNNEAVLEYTFPESWKLKDYTITAVLLSTDYPRLEANSTLTLSN